MTKFLLDTDGVSSASETVSLLNSELNEIISSVSSYDFSEAEDIDFSSALRAITGNLEGAMGKVENTSKLINTVVEAHTNLQNSMKFEPVILTETISNNATIPMAIPTVETDSNETKNNTTVSPAQMQNSAIETTNQNNINASDTYMVQKGDTLTEIASKYGTTVAELAAINNIQNVNKIYVGDKLNINQTEEPKESKTDIETLENTDKTITPSNLNEYKNNESIGFIVTEGNKTYQLSQSDKELLMAVVAAEADLSSKDDCLGVVSVILNRCEDSYHVNRYGNSPIDQIIGYKQFSGYGEGEGGFLKYMNGNVPDTVKTAVEDALNGLRNCDYLSFRSNETTSYSDNMISDDGNRYA